MTMWYRPGPQNLPCTHGAIEVSTLQSCYIVVSELTIVAIMLIHMSPLEMSSLGKNWQTFEKVEFDIGGLTQSSGSKQC